VEVRFEFSDENGAHLAEIHAAAESENPLIFPHSADVVVCTSRTLQFRRRMQTGSVVVWSTENTIISAEKPHFFAEKSRAGHLPRMRPAGITNA
jgi:hypothetical protein